MCLCLNQFYVQVNSRRYSTDTMEKATHYNRGGKTKCKRGRESKRDEKTQIWNSLFWREKKQTDILVINLLSQAKLLLT